MGLPNRAWPSDLGSAIRVANESRNPRMAFRFFIVIADLSTPYNGIGLTQVSGLCEKVLKELERLFFQMASSQHSPRGGDIWRVSFQERFLRTVTPSSWEAGDAWREPLESGRFREWDCSVNFLPTLLVSEFCDVISATPGKYSTINVRHFYHTLHSVTLERRKEGYGGAAMHLAAFNCNSKNRVVSTETNPAAGR
jgi:hypothetical protein